jgi:hypothetical protein
MNVNELANLWLAAKREEQEANAKRIRIEEELCALIDVREEGSCTTHLPSGLVITTTGKLSYKVNVDALQKLVMAWPDEAKPIKVETKADETALKKIRATRPDLWQQIAAAVTVKPAKTGVTIELQP